jgi:hypothetical protein
MAIRRRVVSLGMLLPAMSLAFTFAAQASSSGTEMALVDARVDGIAVNQTSVDLTAYPAMTPYHLLVLDAGWQSRLKEVQKGDRLSVVMATDKDGQAQLQSLTFKTVSVSPRHRVWVLLCTAALFLLISTLLVWGNPLKLILGEDQRYSNSKFQMGLWFFAAIVTYVATVWLRARGLGADFLGIVNIPQNLLLLSGMSALSFAAAKGITTSKVQSALERGQLAPKPKGKPNFFYDLTHNDTGQLDLGDFQMLVITLVATVMYIALSFHFLGTLETRSAVSLPDVDTTILAAFGLGQGAYLAKKAVGDVAKS